MYQYKFISCNKYTTLGIMIMEEAIHLWGLEYENSLFSAQLCSEPRIGSFKKKKCILYTNEWTV